ncbi:MAG: DUF6000 family protein [Polyangiales bacterium]
MASPFAKLEVPFVDEALSVETHKTWVWPFYLKRPHTNEFREALHAQFDEIDEALVVRLLSSRNWRPRIVGGYLAAAANLVGLEEHLGRLFLRSDACYAGRGYCQAITRFNTPASVSVLRQYLDYYLEKHEYYFEQGEAMAALTHLDAENGTALSREYDERWARYVEGKGWELPRIVERFERDRIALCRP